MFQNVVLCISVKRFFLGFDNLLALTISRQWNNSKIKYVEFSAQNTSVLYVFAKGP